MKDRGMFFRYSVRPRSHNQTNDSVGDHKRAGLDNVPGIFIPSGRAVALSYTVHIFCQSAQLRSGDVRACHRDPSNDWVSICPT